MELVFVSLTKYSSDQMKDNIKMDVEEIRGRGMD
jgi:hypothetical protein